MKSFKSVFHILIKRELIQVCYPIVVIRKVLNNELDLSAFDSIFFFKPLHFEMDYRVKFEVNEIITYVILTVFMV